MTLRTEEDGMEWLLTATIETAEQRKAIKPEELERVIVDSTVQELQMARPTTCRCYRLARQPEFPPSLHRY